MPDSRRLKLSAAPLLHTVPLCPVPDTVSWAIGSIKLERLGRNLLEKHCMCFSYLFAQTPYTCSEWCPG